MNNTIRKIRAISTEGMVQQDIEVPKDNSLYGEVILAKVAELFQAQPEAKAILIGVDLKGFPSRDEESVAFAALRAAGYGWRMEGWTGKKSAYDGLLVTRK